MTSSTAIIDKLTRGAAGYREEARAPQVEQRIVINQPLAKVHAIFSDHAASGARYPAADPSFHRSERVLGRAVEVRYTFHAVPGGTQVTAIAEAEWRGALDPAGALAVRSARRQIDEELRALRGRLE